MIRSITVTTIPHDEQRYDTIGDWLVDGDHLTIFTSELSDWRMSMACAVHEIIEACLCVQDGVSESAVSAFDENFERERRKGKHAAHEEPGESPLAPYRRQHAFADGVERMFANALGIVWYRYQEKVENLDYRPERSQCQSSPAKSVPSEGTR